MFFLSLSLGGGPKPQTPPLRPRARSRVSLQPPPPSLSLSLSLSLARARSLFPPSSSSSFLTFSNNSLVLFQVWDASIILAKWLEKNARKGSELSRARLAGKKVLELGAGPGLGGLAAAALGADVELTDVAEVLPLLKQNAEALMGKASLATSDAAWVAGAGSVSVRELDWDRRETWFSGRRKEEERGGGKGGGARKGKEGGEGGGGGGGGGGGEAAPSSEGASLSPPPPPSHHYDFILAADCVYKEDILPTLRDVILALSSRKTVVVVANELRSHSVAAAFDATFAPHFTMKRVPRAKMDAEYSVDAISIVVMKRRHAPPAGGAVAVAVDDDAVKVKPPEEE